MNSTQRTISKSWFQIPAQASMKIQKIFDRFYQSENKYRGKNAGTGVGLHLSRSIMNLLHGTIVARNKKEEKGAEFIIRLPLGKEHLSSKEINTSSATKESVETIIEQPISLYEQPNPVPENKIKPKTNSKY